MTAAELATDAVECAQAEARAFHVHPRDAAGRERLDGTVDEVVTVVRRPHGLPVGVTTGAWIEPDVSQGVALVSRWRAPDYATVNMSEDGAGQVMDALLVAGVGIEAGVWTVEDAEALARTGLGDRVLRVCIEPVEVAAADAREVVGAIHEALDRHDMRAPRLGRASSALVSPTEPGTRTEALLTRATGSRWLA
jgi:uncharacterized protein (DUF849 family)